MPSPDIDPMAYPLPGVGPSRPCTMTFSAQRYEPRRPTPAYRAGGRPTQLILQGVDEALRTEMLRVLSPTLAFPPPDAVFLTQFVRLDRRGTGVEREVLTQKLRRPYESLEKRAGMMMKKSIAGLVTVWVPLRNGTRHIWNSAIRLVGLFKRFLRNAVGQLVGAGRVPMIRVEVA